MRGFVKIFCALALLCAAAGCGRSEAGPERIDFERTLTDLQRLRLSEMSVSKVGRITDPRLRDATDLVSAAEAALGHLKVGTRIGVYSYNTYLTCWVDLSQLRPGDVVVDEDARTVRVTLPPLEVGYAGRDMEMREEHVRVTGLRSDITPQERAELKERMAESLRREVTADPEVERLLRDEARRSAARLVTELAARQGLEAQVTFRK